MIFSTSGVAQWFRSLGTPTILFTWPQGNTNRKETVPPPHIVVRSLEGYKFRAKKAWVYIWNLDWAAPLGAISFYFQNIFPFTEQGLDPWSSHCRHHSNLMPVLYQWAIWLTVIYYQILPQAKFQHVILHGKKFRSCTVCK